MNTRLIGKVSDAGKDGGQKGKRASEDEMAGQHHQCRGRELVQAPGDGGGQGGLRAAVHGVAETRKAPGHWTAAVTFH